MVKVTDAPRRRRTLLAWAGSIVGGALLLWLASQRIQLWPESVMVARPELLALAAALYLPYSYLRAWRLRFAVDPLVREASGGARGAGDALVLGSGWVSFLVILLLPLRLGEVSRPVLLARPGRPGLGLAEAVSAVATERVVDGLMVVALLFVGLATAAHADAGAAMDVQAFARGMALVFAVALACLVFAAAAPQAVVRMARPFLRLLGEARGQRVLDGVERAAGALRPLGRWRQGGPFLLISALYWGITVLQSLLLLRACGLDLGLAEASTLVAAVGLSIQLPGGPAQAGSFQVGAAVGLGLFVDEAALAGPGSSFTAILYLVGLVGALVMAIPGAWLMARAVRDRPAAANEGDESGP